MCKVYSHCEAVAREAGQKQKEAMYRKKSVEAAAAISKIWERRVRQGKARQDEATKMEETMKRLGITL